LLAKGVNTDSRDAKDRTPLSLAAEYGHEAVVKLLSKDLMELIPPPTVVGDVDTNCMPIPTQGGEVTG
jgi:ankyrin repeat protein